MNKKSVIEELQELAPLLAKLRKLPQDQLGSLPEGYFDDLEKGLAKKIEGVEELKGMAIFLATIAKNKEAQLGEVPEGYFDALEQKILAISKEDDMVDVSLPEQYKSKASLGEVPEDYFNTFEAKLALKLNEEESFPLLDSIEKSKSKQLGEVPEGYFEKLKGELDQKTAVAKKEPNILKINKQNRKARINPYYIMAAAASVMLLIITGLWFLKGGKTDSPFAYEQMINLNIDEGFEKVELAEASDYLMENIDGLETTDLVDGLDEETIEGLRSSDLLPMVTTIDSLPPIITQQENQNNTTLQSSINKPEPNPYEKSAGANLKEELEDEIADDSDLDELFGKMDDTDLDALEAALLKPKNTPEPKKESSENKK